MILTSAAANKQIKKLKDEKDYLLELEDEASTYIEVADMPTEKPEYCYSETEKQIEALDEKIRKIKHAVNVMNATTEVPDFNMTVDEALVYMAQLNKRKDKLDTMRKRLPKQRRTGDFYNRASNLVEFCVVNYDIGEVKKDYNRIADEIASLQMAIDHINHTVKFEVDI